MPLTSIQREVVRREGARMRECPFRRFQGGAGTCGDVTARLGWDHGLHIDQCDVCWSMGGPDVEEAKRYRGKLAADVVQKLIDYTPIERVPIAVALTIAGRHLAGDESKKMLRALALRGNREDVLKAAKTHGPGFITELARVIDAAGEAGRVEARDPSLRWGDVQATWQEAAAVEENIKKGTITDFLRSLWSRGFTNKKCSEQEYEERHRSCFGDVPGKGVAPAKACPSLRLAEDGGHYCNDCGCGAKKIARLDDPDYPKLYYPWLMCPRRRPGFTNAIGVAPTTHLPVVEVKRKVDLRGVFERVVCVNLDRRVDRWERFMENVAAVDWPLAPVRRYRGTDGSLVPAPEGWTWGGGTWGCMQSHRGLLEEALQDGVKTLLVLEDDAHFPSDFEERLREFLEVVPGDWDGLMIGGQHIAQGMRGKAPVPMGSGVVRCMNCQRTHAYALRGKYIEGLYKELSSRDGHCDHIMGDIQPKWRVYAPERFIVGQDGGKSDISGRDNKVTFWNEPRGDDPVIVVAGLWLDGGEVLAHALRKCGVHFGNTLEPPDKWHPWGPCVDSGLEDICQRLLPFPARVSRYPSSYALERLTAWRRVVGAEACNMGVPLGMRHPTLAFMLPWVRQVMGANCRVAAYYRGNDEGMRALEQRCVEERERGVGVTTAEDAEALQYALQQVLVEDVGKAKNQSQIVTPEQLVDAPGEALMRVCGSVGWEPKEENLAQAVAWLKVVAEGKLPEVPSV